MCVCHGGGGGARPWPKIETGDGVIRTNSAQTKNCTSNLRGMRVYAGLSLFLISPLYPELRSEHDILAV